jgi:hypothetical protein
MLLAPSIGVHEQGNVAKHVEADDPSEMDPVGWLW